MSKICHTVGVKSEFVLHYIKYFGSGHYTTVLKSIVCYIKCKKMKYLFTFSILKLLFVLTWVQDGFLSSKGTFTIHVTVLTT